MQNDMTLTGLSLPPLPHTRLPGPVVMAHAAVIEAWEGEALEQKREGLGAQVSPWRRPERLWGKDSPSLVQLV